MPPDILVRFERRNRTYYPGEYISCWVLFRNLRPLSQVREISVRWIAYSQTWESKKRAVKTYCNMKVGIFKESQQGRLLFPAVSHSFGTTLPIDCPPTFKGKHGRIRYLVSATIDYKWWPNKVENVEFLVSRKLMGLPPTVWVEPVSKISRHRAGCFMREEYIDVKATIPKLAFSCGESSEMHLSVRNGSGAHILRFFVFLIVRSHFHIAPVDFICRPYTKDCPVPPDFSIDIKDPLEEIHWLHEYVAPYSDRDVTIPFVISKDANVPGFESELISMNYLLRGFMKLEGGDVIIAEFDVWVGEKGDGVEEEEKENPEEEPVEEVSELLVNISI